MKQKIICTRAFVAKTNMRTDFPIKQGCILDLKTPRDPYTVCTVVDKLKMDVCVHKDDLKNCFIELTEDNWNFLLPIEDPYRRYTFFTSHLQSNDLLKVGEHATVEHGARQLKCVVKYIGPLPPREGTWFGVELSDDFNKGESNGKYKGKQYFKCVEPNAGLFVTRDKLIKRRVYQQNEQAGAGAAWTNPRSGDGGERGHVPQKSVQSLETFHIGDIVRWPMEGEAGRMEIGEITSFSPPKVVVKRTGELFEDIGIVERDGNLPSEAVIPVSKLILYEQGQKNAHDSLAAAKQDDALNPLYLIGKRAIWKGISCTIRNIVPQDDPPILFFIVECEQYVLHDLREAFIPQDASQYGKHGYVIQTPQSSLTSFTDENGIQLNKSKLSQSLQCFQVNSGMDRPPTSPAAVVPPEKTPHSQELNQKQGFRYFICSRNIAYDNSASQRFYIDEGALIKVREMVYDFALACVWDDDTVEACIPSRFLKRPFTTEINGREFGILRTIKERWNRQSLFTGSLNMLKICSEVLVVGLRVKVGRFCGMVHNKAKVRYIGEVDGKEGIWFGLEVNEYIGSKQGKSNNTVYFECKKGYGRFVSADEIQEDSEYPVLDQRRGEKVKWCIEENHFGIGIIEKIIWDGVCHKATVKYTADDLGEIGVIPSDQKEQYVHIPLTELTVLEASLSDNSLIGNKAKFEIRTNQIFCTIKDVIISLTEDVKLNDVHVIVECDEWIPSRYGLDLIHDEKYGKKDHVIVIPFRRLRLYTSRGTVISDKEARRMLKEDYRRRKKEALKMAEDQEKIQMAKDQEKIQMAKDQEKIQMAKDQEKMKMEVDKPAADEPVVVGGIILKATELMFEDLNEKNFPTLVNVDKDDVVLVEINGLKLNGYLRWTGVVDGSTACVGIEMINHTEHGTDGSFNDTKLFDCEPGLGVLVRAHLVHPMDAFDEPAKAAPAKDVSRGQPAESVAGDNPPDEPMEVAEEAVETETEYQKFVNSLVASDIPTCFGDGGPIEIDCAIETEITSPKLEIRYGSVRWTGFGGDNRPVVGVELDGYVDHGTDGTFEGVNLFDCKPDRGLILPADRINRDRRFTTMVKAQEVAEDKIPAKYKEYTEAVKGATLPDRELDPGWLKAFRGIQGTKNSCYMDATLFAMFAFNSVLDGFLHKPLEDRNAKGENGRNVQDILREEIVNPLRRKRYVSSKNIMKLREALQRISTVAGLLGEEKDPEEFLNALLRILRGDPLLEMSSGQTTYLYQLFLDDTKIDKQTSPNIQFLVEHSFHQIELKLKKIPHCFILQMPRHGKSYKMFERIVPNLTLDITYLLDDYPRACGSCKSKPDVARYECKTCFKEKGNMEQASFCDSCYADHKKKEKKHETMKLKDEMSGIKPCTETMELFAVVCIETSHYISFVKAAKDWVFFDSMWDRRGTFNVPQVEKIKDFEKWFVRNPPERLDEMQRRLFCDAYLCMYRNTNQANYG